jgi:large subunit ribosomal protein L28e
MGRMDADYKQAVAVGFGKGDKGGVTVITKKQKHPQKPLAAAHETTFGGNKTARK